MSKPCDCHECIVAGCDRPPVTLPATKWIPAKTLHGRELRQHYEAQDRFRATLEGLKGKSPELAKAALKLVNPERREP